MNRVLYLLKKNRVIVFLLVVISAVLIFISMSGPKVVNPNKNNLDENREAGRSYALLYNHAELYKAIDSNDDTLKRIQQDMALFARQTRPEFKDPNSLIGFTFDKKYENAGKKYTFTGHYYSIKDEVKVVLTILNKGAVRLSITNLKDGTNIDESLNLNGSKSKLLALLPIESDFYTVRYSNTDDRIVATFYQGYSSKDVDTVVDLFKENYGNKYKESDFIFNLNSKGIYSVQEIRDNLVRPIPL